MDPFRSLVDDLSQAELGPPASLYNIYRHSQEPGERADGAARRRANLLTYLEERRRAPVVAVGEAAGYQGMRFSGIAFTSERNLLAWGGPYRPSSSRAEGWAEPSATIVHRVLADLGLEHDVLLWNAVPAHPRRPGQPLTNRRPTTAEISLGGPYLERLLDLVAPAVTVAVGRVAQSLLTPLLGDVPCVRHPANGGARKFESGMRELLG